MAYNGYYPPPQGTQPSYGAPAQGYYGAPPQQQQQQPLPGFPPGGAPQAGQYQQPPPPAGGTPRNFAAPSPSQGYGFPPPPPQQYGGGGPGYGAPMGGPPPPQPYGYQGPPQGGPPAGPPQNWGAPPTGPPQNWGGPPTGPPQNWGGPPTGPPTGWGGPPQPQYGGPPQPVGSPMPPQPPMGFPPPQPPPQPPHINVSQEVFSIHKACKGFGTDEKTLITILSHRDGPTIDAIRRAYATAHGDLISVLSSETSGNFKTTLIATALGPLESEVFWTHKAVAGMGTNEAMLTEAVMGKTTVQLQQMRHLYQQRYGTSMDKAIRDDLSMKTEKLFTMALEARKPEEHIPATPQQAQADAVAVYKATKGRIGTDELAVCRIFTQSNVAQLKAIVYEYERQHGSLVECIKKEFSGHMRDALLFILEGAIDPVRRDAVLLEMSMKGLGTKDDLLIMRVVRCHWNRIHMESVKNAYKNLYKRSLADRIKGETSGHYREMLLALVA